MLRLFQFPPNFGVPNPSPFCLKVETWLRMAGMDYQVKTVFDPRKAPKGKLPFIELDGRVIAEDTALPGVKLLTPRVFGDDRGFFLESWNARIAELRNLWRAEELRVRYRECVGSIHDDIAAILDGPHGPPTLEALLSEHDDDEPWNWDMPADLRAAA